MQKNKKEIVIFFFIRKVVLWYGICLVISGLNDRFLRFQNQNENQ